MERTILHSDMNNFYASVECLYHPHLRGKPLAVAGDPVERHGIILAKNDLAKRYGVQTGDPIWMACQKCPELLLVEPDFNKYLHFSAMAREIYAGYTRQVEAFGLDECWLDLTGDVHRLGEGREIANRLRGQIRRELGITVSVGVSFNKVFAKLGSDMKKPDATTVILRESFRDTVWPLPVGDLLYVGRATGKRLCGYGITTIGALARTDPRFLESRLGKVGLLLWNFANGRDVSPVAEFEEEPPVKSIGNSTTTPYDLVKDEDIRITLWVLAESVAERMRRDGFLCRCVQLQVRDCQLHSYQRQRTLPRPVETAGELVETAFELYRRNRPEHPVRSLGLGACRLTTGEGLQLSLLDGEDKRQKLERLERTVDGIRGRFGHFSVQRGVMLTQPRLSALDPIADHVIHPVGLLRSPAG